MSLGSSQGSVNFCSSWEGHGWDLEVVLYFLRPFLNQAGHPDTKSERISYAGSFMEIILMREHNAGDINPMTI